GTSGGSNCHDPYQNDEKQSLRRAVDPTVMKMALDLHVHWPPVWVSEHSRSPGLPQHYMNVSGKKLYPILRKFRAEHHRS
ncbi:MAG: hypothetical protein SV862_03570, partial [Pseudomonadota bacterium]|nr:hypothetical protein [Pseudomonadota bacterium]